MSQEQVNKFIEEQRRKGYDDATIMRHLSESGIDPAYIEQHNPPLSLFRIFLLIIFLVLITIGAVLIYRNLFAPQIIPSGESPAGGGVTGQPIGINVELVSDKVLSDQDMVFVITFTSGIVPGSEIEYRIKDEAGNLLTSTIEEKPISGKKVSRSIMVPGSAESGRYVIEVAVSSGGKDYISKSRPFIVVNYLEGLDAELSSASLRSCPGSCDDNNGCTQDHCSSSTEYLCANDPIPGCCGNNICEEGEDCMIDCSKQISDNVQDTISKARSIALNNEQGAVNLCISLEVAAYVDECYSKVAVSSSSYKYCELIDNVIRKDFCTMNIILKTKDYILCNQIIDYDTREDCFKLREYALKKAA